jgi:hypothetical protein
MKFRILYCDDNEEFLKTFCARHRADFDIEVLNKISDLYDNVTKRKDAALPDLLLLDLYHPSLPDENNVEWQAARMRAETKLAELSDMISEVRDCVNQAWSPTAIDVLQELRRVYPAHKLPIMIYTQRGLLLLKDDEIRRIEQAGADWLLKDPERISGTTEAIRIRRFVAQAQAARRLPRDVRLTIWSVAASTVLGAAIGAIITLLAT